MIAVPGPTQDPSSLVPIILVVITGLVVFWRTAVKLLAISAVLLMTLGLSELLHTLH